jgi:hypothetical protein
VDAGPLEDVEFPLSGFTTEPAPFMRPDVFGAADAMLASSGKPLPSGLFATHVSCFVGRGLTSRYPVGGLVGVNPTLYGLVDASKFVVGPANGRGFRPNDERAGAPCV